MILRYCDECGKEITDGDEHYVTSEHKSKEYIIFTSNTLCGDCFKKLLDKGAVYKVCKL